MMLKVHNFVMKEPFCFSFSLTHMIQAEKLKIYSRSEIPDTGAERRSSTVSLKLHQRCSQWKDGCQEAASLIRGTGLRGEMDAHHGQEDVHHRVYRHLRNTVQTLSRFGLRVSQRCWTSLIKLMNYKVRKSEFEPPCSNIWKHRSGSSFIFQRVWREREIPTWFRLESLDMDGSPGRSSRNAKCWLSWADQQLLRQKYMKL